MTDPVRILHRRDFQHLLNALASRGYRIVGPTVRDGAIVYDEIHAASDLPEGWTDRQDGGILFHRYRFSSIRYAIACRSRRSSQPVSTPSTVCSAAGSITGSSLYIGRSDRRRSSRGT